MSSFPVRIPAPLVVFQRVAGNHRDHHSAHANDTLTFYIKKDRPNVTKLVNVFKGLTTISYCADSEPAWPTPADLPAEAPAGWPNCETVFSGKG